MASLPSSRPAVAPAEDYIDPRRWWALAFIVIAQLMIVLDATIVSIALPSMQRDLNMSDANRQWVITAYTLAFGSLLLLGGRLADFLGRKRTLIIGLIGFAAASALGGAAQSVPMILGARTLQGAFGALLAPSALSLLAMTFRNPAERAKAIGVFGAASSGGAALGLILGGVLTDYLDWRFTLYVNVPMAVIAVLGARAFVRADLKSSNKVRFDFGGAVLGTAGLFSLVYSFAKAETDGWGAGVTLGFLAAAAVLLVGFVAYESRIDHALLPVRILKNRNRVGSYIAVLTAYAAMFSTFFFLTYYMQGILHYSPVKSGFAFLPMPFMVVIFAQTASRLIQRIPARLMLIPGMIFAGAAMIWLTQLNPDSSWLTHVAPVLALFGMGTGLIVVTAISTATSGTQPGDAGVASAMVNTSQQIGASIGTSLLSTIAASASTDYLRNRTADATTQVAALVHGYNVAAEWSVAIMLGGAVVVGLLVNASRPKPAATNGAAASQPEAEISVVHV